jgi:sedoheptulokinase
MIDKRNFTPQALILGFLRGMCNELYDLYECLGEKRNNVVVSGGAVRKNDVLKRLIADRFLAAVSVSVVEEEAATGAALFSAFCVGKIKYNNGFSEYIIYN